MSSSTVVLFRAVQVAVGLVFLQAAVYKVAHPIQFARELADYKLLPSSLSFIFGLSVPVVELLMAVSHLSGYLVTVTAPIGMLSLFVFLFAVISVILRDVQIPCRCFGVRSQEFVGRATVIRLTVMIVGEGLVIAIGRRIQSLRPEWLSFSPFRDIVTVVTWSGLLLLLSIWIINIANVSALLERTFVKHKPRPRSGIGNG